MPPIKVPLCSTSEEKVQSLVRNIFALQIPEIESTFPTYSEFFRLLTLGSARSVAKYSNPSSIRPVALSLVVKALLSCLDMKGISDHPVGTKTKLLFDALASAAVGMAKAGLSAPDCIDQYGIVSCDAVFYRLKYSSALRPGQMLDICMPSA